MKAFLWYMRIVDASDNPLGVIVWTVGLLLAALLIIFTDIGKHP